MSPLISIVIPVYNLEGYIEKTLDSVFAQTYDNIEVIAVNDGSADKTAEILDRYAEKENRLRVIHKENGGVTSARMSGIKAALGEYIGFVDGDDLIDSDMYEKLVNNVLKYDADISHCGYRRISENGTEYFYNTGELRIQDNETGLYDLLEGRIIEPGLWNKLFRKELFSKLISGQSIMDTSFKENEDLLMNYCLFEESGKSVFEDFCPYQYIIRNNSSSHGRIKPHILTDPINIGQILVRHTSENPKLNRIASRYYVVKLIQAATRTYDAADDNLKAIKKNAQKQLREFLPVYLEFNEESKSKKILAVLAAYSPKLYNSIHKIYLNRK